MSLFILLSLFAQLYDIKYFYLIQIIFNRSMWIIDRTLKATTKLAQSWSWSNGSEWSLHVHHISRTRPSLPEISDLSRTPLMGDLAWCRCILSAICIMTQGQMYLVTVSFAPILAFSYSITNLLKNIFKSF